MLFVLRLGDVKIPVLMTGCKGLCTLESRRVVVMDNDFDLTSLRKERFLSKLLLDALLNARHLACPAKQINLAILLKEQSLLLVIHLAKSLSDQVHETWLFRAEK